MAAGTALTIALSVSGALAIAIIVMARRGVACRKRLDGLISESRDNERRYRTVIETIPHGIQENDTAGRITFSNTAHCRMLGFAPGGLLGKAIWDMHASGSEQQRLREYLEYLVKAQPEPQPYVTKNITADGRVIDVQVDWNYKRGVQGRIEGFISVVTDITQRVRSERAMQESEARFRAIFDGAAIGIVVADMEGRITMANRALEKMVGYGAGELLGRYFAELTHPEDAGKDAGLYKELAAGTRDGYHIEKRYLARNGAVIDAELAVSNFPSMGGQPRLAIGMVRDVTERKRMAGELLNRERLAVLGQITATVAHDLRNPMFAMRQFAQALEKDLPPDRPELAAALAGIRDGVAECDHIVGELLEFTRSSRLNVEPTAIDRLLRELVDGEHWPRQITVRTDLRLGDRPVAADAQRLRRAVMNVVDNARDSLAQAMPERKDADLRIELATRCAGGRVEVEVSDNGQGIPKKLLPRVFEPLFSTKPSGYGLGLSIVKEVMEEHRGGVTIDSEEGKGTRVVLWLPAERAGDEGAGPGT